MIDNDQIELLSVSEAARVTGLGRGTIARAMLSWDVTRGRQGLRYVQPTTRRLVRRAALLDWMQQMERMSAHGE